jgi:hypothetical protein
MNEAYQDRSKLKNTKRTIEYLKKNRFLPSRLIVDHNR